MTHAARDPQFVHQPHEPAHRSGRFNPDHNWRRQSPIKRPHGLTFVLQRLLADLTRLAIQHDNGLLARVQITSYNRHLWSARSVRCLSLTALNAQPTTKRE